MELQEAAAKIMAAKPFKIVLSAPRKTAAYTRAEITPLAGGWQLAQFTDKQVFHKNLPGEALCETLAVLLEGEYTQLNAFGETGGMALRVSKKGKVLLRETGGGAPAKKPGAQGAAPPAHNRQKGALLPEGTVVPPLVDMGIFTADGRVKQGMYAKYRQVNRFIELVDDAFKKEKPQRLSVIDFGCGKSYLTFVLYYYLREILGIEARITGLDLKADVVESCNAAARKYGYSGLSFEVGDIAGYRCEGPVDMVMTLHACDTATDHALASAVAWGAGRIFSVPCCQHELNGQMQSEGFGILTRYGLVQERVAALMTDAVRANLLAACGYKTQLVEFVELEHTPKNILIRAQRGAVPGAKREACLAEVRSLCAEFGFSPTLLALLQAQGAIPHWGK